VIGAKLYEGMEEKFSADQDLLRAGHVSAGFADNYRWYRQASKDGDWEPVHLGASIGMARRLFSFEETTVFIC
jgi:hypothetical protein